VPYFTGERKKIALQEIQVQDGVFSI